MARTGGPGRAGWVAKGVVYALIGMLAVPIAFGRPATVDCSAPERPAAGLVPIEAPASARPSKDLLPYRAPAGCVTVSEPELTLT